MSVGFAHDSGAPPLSGLPVIREAIAISTLANADMPANLFVKRACVHYRINALPSHAPRSICAAAPREAGGTLKA
jgi:hypothetical protein